jgi:hypothetical protein
LPDQLRPNALGHAEIEDLGTSSPGKNDIGRFYIPMNDSRGVSGF